MAFLAVTGSPPFGMFLSEFTILRGIFGAGQTWVGLTVVLLLATVFIGMAASVLAVSQGEPVGRDLTFTDRFLLVVPPLVLLLGGAAARPVPAGAAAPARSSRRRH